MNVFEKMGKKANVDATDILMRIIQIIVLLIAVYIILKGLGVEIGI